MAITIAWLEADKYNFKKFLDAVKFLVKNSATYMEEEINEQANDNQTALMTVSVPLNQVS